MTCPRSTPISIPLPAAVLALSVAVSLCSAGAMGASPMLLERQAQADQRQSIEHLLDAISQAAKKLTDRLTGQATLAQRDAIRPALALCPTTPSPAERCSPAQLLLRDALLNLPPPAC